MEIENSEELEKWLRGVFSITVDGDFIILKYEPGKFTDEQNFIVAQNVIKQLQEIFDRDPNKKYIFLMDLTDITNLFVYLSKRVRAEYAKLTNNPQAAKIAVLGASTYYEITIKVILEMVHQKEKMKFFKDRDEAMAWLRSSPVN
jgi:hypothetical protein